MNPFGLDSMVRSRIAELEREGAREQRARRAQPRRSSPQQRAERVYSLAISLFWLAVALPAALSVLLMQARGLDLFGVGMLMGAYSLTVVLFEFPSGALADAVGRKRTALIAYGFLLAAGLVFLLAFSFWAFLLSFVLNGVGRTFASGALSAWLIDRLQEADPGVDLQPPLARAGTFELLALTLGSLLGGFLPSLFGGLPQDGSAVLTPLSVAVALSIPVKLALIAVVALFVDERPTPRSGGAAAGLGGLTVALRESFGLARERPVLRLLLGATLAGGFALAGLETFWQPRFASLLGGSEGNTPLFGVIMAGSFLVGMVGNLASIPLCRLFKRRYALVTALFRGLQGGTLVVLALQTSTLPAAALFWLVYFSLAVGGSPGSALLNGEIPRDRRATLLSVSSLASYAGFFLGSVILGYVAERTSIGFAWTVAGAVATLSATLYVTADAALSRRSGHPGAGVSSL